MGAMKQDVEAGTFEMIYADHTSYAVAHSLQTAFVASGRRALRLDCR